MIGVEWSGYMSEGELKRAAVERRYARHRIALRNRLALLCASAGVPTEVGFRHLNGVGAWEMVCDGLPDGEIIAFLLELRGFTRVVLP